MKHTVKSSWNYLKYLFLLGPFLAMTGITIGVIQNKWDFRSIGLLSIGIGMILIWLIIIISKEGTLSKRSTRAGTNAFTATLSLLIILGLINILAVRYSVIIDITENQLFTLAPQSVSIVKNLELPIKILVFDPNQNAYDRELLENYRRVSKDFSYSFIDPLKQLELAQRFQVKEPGEVYVEYDNKRQFIQKVSETERLNESKITNTLDQLKETRLDKIYFLSGHGEKPLDPIQGGISQAVTNLQSKNFTSISLNLAQTTLIPNDAKIILIVEPKQPLLPQEIALLKNYLNQGGNLYLLSGFNSNSGLDQLLAEWGIKLDNRLIIDQKGAEEYTQSQPIITFITQYGNHPITKDFGNNITIYPLARAIQSSNVPGIQNTPLLITNKESWAEANPQETNFTFNPPQDLAGPLVIGVALSKIIPNPQTPNESRIVIIGNSEFMADGLFNRQLNSDLFLNSVTWLSKRTQSTLSIRPKEIKNRRLELNNEQQRILQFLAIIILPLSGLLLGLIVWFRRR